ncbi:MAG TPA: hypothetical protein VE010_14515 [Thermoanaerobaculia bacterium]|nr:hypothetical protein [Thermoanaerobaculia bacterium]
MKRALAVLSLLLLTGCFEVEQSIDLERNLSGKAGFRLGVDLEPMVVVMARFARVMDWKSGPMSAEELAKAKAEFKKSSSNVKEKLSRADIEAQLPEGVTLLDFAIDERDFGVVSDFRFGFERISQLVGVKLPSKGKKPTDRTIIDSPFEGLEVSESANTITIRSKPQNPPEAVKAEAGDLELDEATKQIVRDAFGKMRVAYRITAPFEVVSHNATRRDGKTLVWEYDLRTLEEMMKSKSVDAAQLRVTYRR